MTLDWSKDGTDRASWDVDQMKESETWLSEILVAVRHIADRPYQEQAWFGKSYEISSPDEVYCELLDNLNFELYLQRFRSTLTTEQAAAWLDLQIGMDQFASKYVGQMDPYIVFSDPRWIDVQATASAFLAAFDYGSTF
ncbi:hypothetical protein [Granulicella arctica]|uniref:hypothetical protein n=1 Tax=Granulicella arctica TaxID=940613 RepID=UPI0021DFEC15|nr:hypothetical protein [Granulicella arctica]